MFNIHFHFAAGHTLLSLLDYAVEVSLVSVYDPHQGPGLYRLSDRCQMPDNGLIA